MYKYLLIALALFTLWKSRLYLLGLFHSVKRSKTDDSKEMVFEPVEVKKTYQFLIELQDLGDGSAKIAILKNKNADN